MKLSELDIILGKKSKDKISLIVGDIQTMVTYWNNLCIIHSEEKNTNVKLRLTYEMDMVKAWINWNKRKNVNK